jgi:hypothetical protein
LAAFEFTYSEGKAMAMSKPQPISVYVVALTCAALHGAVAIVVVPILAIILCSSAPANLYIDRIMLFAVVAPAITAAFGFIAGGLMAAGYNLFAKEQRRVSVMVSEPPQVQVASFGRVA